jgi:hypothetical protein
LRTAFLIQISKTVSALSSNASSRSFQMESEILIGAWGSTPTSFCDRQRAGGVGFFKSS